jgi:hypothetical protein
MSSGHGSLFPAKINGLNLGIITSIKSKIELDLLSKHCTKILTVFGQRKLKLEHENFTFDIFQRSKKLNNNSIQTLPVYCVKIKTKTINKRKLKLDHRNQIFLFFNEGT